MQEYKNFDNLIKEIKESLVKKPSLSGKKWNQFVRKYRSDENKILSKNEILEYILKKGIVLENEVLESIKMKPTRTISGVTPITIFTKPNKCSGNCIFCPTSSQTPKSYLTQEPGIQRALSLNYNPFEQIRMRIKALKAIGHNTEKIELILSGGTWDDYDLNYQYWFVMESFRALNNLKSQSFKNDTEYFKMKDELKKLQRINEDTKVKNIGMCVETRPDKINLETLKKYRLFGITKVQLGVQSLNDEVLEKNCRGHNLKTTSQAIGLLRSCGFKIHIHWMCNLLGSNLTLDYIDFKKIWSNLNIKPDEIKIYPCSVTKESQLYEIFNKGEYIPYSTEELINLLLKCKSLVPNYCRINRVIRDIPSDLIVAGNTATNLREVIQRRMKKKCQCIRCREIRQDSFVFLKLKRTKYKTKVSNEYFLEYVNEDNKIAGFLRLSILNENSPLVKTKALVRELHVYGVSLKLSEKNKHSKQHKGLGSKLLLEAENLAKKLNVDNIAVISGVGTRNYYKKRGYVIEKKYGYALKNLKNVSKEKK